MTDPLVDLRRGAGCLASARSTTSPPFFLLALLTCLTSSVWLRPADIRGMFLLYALNRSYW